MLINDIPYYEKRTRTRYLVWRIIKNVISSTSFRNFILYIKRNKFYIIDFNRFFFFEKDDKYVFKARNVFRVGNF